jgi:pimeloyl-ACP methyl ester carboxylesterase
MKLAQKIAVGYLRTKLNVLSLVSKKKAAESAFKLFCTPMKKSRRKKPPVFAKGEKLHFKVDGKNIVGHRWNAFQEKKCLIAHGFESTSYNFERFVNPLIKNGYEILAFDAPAHGRSDGAQITLPLYMSTLKKIDEKFGPVTAFIGHSFGGLALCHFLETVPNGHRKVVLIAPATETTTAIDSFFRFLHLDKGVRREFDQLIFSKEGKHASEYSIRRAMHHIKSQVLWIHDEDDDVTPLSDVLKIKEDHHPNIEFMITKGFGHRRIYRENQVVKKILEFL